MSSSRCLFTCFKVSILVYKTCVAWIVSSPYMKMILLAKFPSAASSIFPSYCVGILFNIFIVCCLGTNGGVLKSQCSRVWRERGKYLTELRFSPFQWRHWKTFGWFNTNICNTLLYDLELDKRCVYLRDISFYDLWIKFSLCLFIPFLLFDVSFLLL